MGHTFLSLLLYPGASSHWPRWNSGTWRIVRAQSVTIAIGSITNLQLGARVLSKGPTTCYRDHRSREGTRSLLAGSGPGLGQPMTGRGRTMMGRGWGPSPLRNFPCWTRPSGALCLAAPGKCRRQPGEARRDWRRCTVIGRRAGRSVGRAGAAYSGPSLWASLAGSSYSRRLPLVPLPFRPGESFSSRATLRRSGRPEGVRPTQRRVST